MCWIHEVVMHVTYHHPSTWLFQYRLESVDQIEALPPWQNLVDLRLARPIHHDGCQLSMGRHCRVIPPFACWNEQLDPNVEKRPKEKEKFAFLRFMWLDDACGRHYGVEKRDQAIWEAFQQFLINRPQKPDIELKWTVYLMPGPSEKPFTKGTTCAISLPKFSRSTVTPTHIHALLGSRERP